MAFEGFLELHSYHTDDDPQTHGVHIEYEASANTGNENGMLQMNVYVWDSDCYYSHESGDYLVESWSVNLEADVALQISIAIASGSRLTPSRAWDHVDEMCPQVANETMKSRIKEKMTKIATDSLNRTSQEEGSSKSLTVPSKSGEMTDPQPDLPN